MPTFSPLSDRAAHDEILLGLHRAYRDDSVDDAFDQDINDAVAVVAATPWEVPATGGPQSLASRYACRMYDALLFFREGPAGDDVLDLEDLPWLARSLAMLAGDPVERFVRTEGAAQAVFRGYRDESMDRAVAGYLVLDELGRCSGLARWRARLSPRAQELLSQLDTAGLTTSQVESGPWRVFNTILAVSLATSYLVDSFATIAFHPSLDRHERLAAERMRAGVFDAIDVPELEPAHAFRIGLGYGKVGLVEALLETDENTGRRSFDPAHYGRRDWVGEQFRRVEHLLTKLKQLHPEIEEEWNR